MSENIEAERAAFEAWAELTDHQKRGANHEVIGWYYFDEVTQDRWEAWQASAARRATPSSECAEGLGPLPKRAGRVYKGNYWTDSDSANPPGEPIADVYTAEQVEQIRREAVEAISHELWCAEVNLDGANEHLAEVQTELAGLREAVEADRRARVNSPEIPDGSAREQSQQAAQGVKTWQERCDWMSDEPATKLMVEAMKAEIADLRAQLTSAQQDKEYEQRHAVESEKALAQAHAQLARQNQGVDETAAEMKRLHDALCFWLPQNRAELPDAMCERIAADAYLLVGYDDMPDPKSAEELGWIYAAPPLSSEPQVERQSAGQMQNCRSTEKVQVVQAAERQAEKGGA